MNQPEHISIQINKTINTTHISEYSPITPFNSPSSVDSITNNTENEYSTNSQISENSSNDTETENTCSICLENINNKDSILACSCKNPVHIDCLLTWIEYKNTISCEICNTQYSIPNDIIENYYQETNYQQTDYNNQYEPDYNDVEEEIRTREQRILELRRQMYENRMNRLYSGILYSIVLLFILLIIIYFN